MWWIASFLVFLVCGKTFASDTTLAAATVLSIDEAVHRALAANTQVRVAEAQYQAALHQALQPYTPQDPILSFQNAQSTTGLFDPAVRNIGITEAFQFPGKSWLQGNQARRNAKIAYLIYQAAVRDARAQAQTVYFQTLLDQAAADIAAENAASIAQVLEVARVAYTANQVTQSDLISAQFQLSQASQTVLTTQVAEANDEAALNQLMARDPQTPLHLSSAMHLEPLGLSEDAIQEKALAMRQEILEAALTEKNSKTALKLAWMELLPDFNFLFTRNAYWVDTAAPEPGRKEDNTAALGFNVPIFFWFKQKEDIQAASRLLEAARQNRRGVELQTKTSVVQLYRSTQLAYQTALLYKNFLVPLAEKNFRVALVAYQSKKVDFTTLAAARQSLYSARIASLTTTNQFLAGKVALEQLMGGPMQ